MRRTGDAGAKHSTFLPETRILSASADLQVIGALRFHQNHEFTIHEPVQPILEALPDVRRIDGHRDVLPREHV